MSGGAKKATALSVRAVANKPCIPVGSRTPIVGTGIQYSIH